MIAGVMVRPRQTRFFDDKSARCLFRELAIEAVVCVDTGGRPLGQLLAQHSRLPLFGLDIRYPGSRVLDNLPRQLVPLLWPFKELSYKLTAPRPAQNHPAQTLLSSYNRLALVDDSASSGKTLQAALEHLFRAKIPRDKVTIIVGRCGQRARHLVDFVFCKSDTRSTG